MNTLPLNLRYKFTCKNFIIHVMFNVELHSKEVEETEKWLNILKRCPKEIEYTIEDVSLKEALFWLKKKKWSIYWPKISVVWETTHIFLLSNLMFSLFCRIRIKLHTEEGTNKIELQMKMTQEIYK